MAKRTVSYTKKMSDGIDYSSKFESADEKGGGGEGYTRNYNTKNVVVKAPNELYVDENSKKYFKQKSNQSKFKAKAE